MRREDGCGKVDREGETGVPQPESGALRAPEGASSIGRSLRTATSNSTGLRTVVVTSPMTRNPPVDSDTAHICNSTARLLPMLVTELGVDQARRVLATASLASRLGEAKNAESAGLPDFSLFAATVRIGSLLAATRLAAQMLRESLPLDLQPEAEAFRLVGFVA